MKKVSSVDEYIASQHDYREPLSLLRNILLSTELIETVKWNIPTYTINGKNVLGIGAFKNYFGLWFFNGSFLKDKANVLINAQEGKTKGMRQWRFNSIDSINKDLILQYVNEAIVNQQLGKEFKPEKQKKDIVIPIELQNEFNNNNKLFERFNTLTPYKQREYFEYIASAKREATKLNRLEKIKPMLLNGIGLHDKYRN